MSVHKDRERERPARERRVGGERMGVGVPSGGFFYIRLLLLLLLPTPRILRINKTQANVDTHTHTHNVHGSLQDMNDDFREKRKVPFFCIAWSRLIHTPFMIAIFTVYCLTLDFICSS